MIYLDYSASTPLDESVLESMKPYFLSHYANASSVHQAGRDARLAIDLARETICTAIGAKPLEIYFTSGGTEANNLAIRGYILANLSKGSHVISSKIEHQAVLNTLADLSEKKLITLSYVEHDKNGHINLGHFKQLIRKETLLVSIMAINNETGIINPIAEIGALCRKAEIAYHCDAIQAFGKINLNVLALNIDFMSVSSHKLYGPKGIGFLYARKGFVLEKQMSGGHQEFDIRAGTENVPAIVGFAKAAELAIKNINPERDRLEKLKLYFINLLEKTVSNIHINSPKKNTLANIINISFLGVDGESLLMNLDNRGVCVSTGSACTSGSVKVSYVILEISGSEEISQGAIRFSLGKFTTYTEIDLTVQALADSVDFLRKIK
jgi:cysteine desulfurase